MRFNIKPVDEPPFIPAKESWKPQKWAVIGASGFIGKSIVRHLNKAGIDVLKISAPRVNFKLELDPVNGILEAIVGNPVVKQLASEIKDVDVVVNAAGAASPDGTGEETIYGANSLLPAIIAAASIEANVGRLIHLSSAAVQGRSKVIDSSTAVFPFSHYSYSKALGERALLAFLESNPEMDISIVRATSVQGTGRPTTEKLQRLAQTPLASVASPGSQPSVVSSVTALCEFIQLIGEYRNTRAVIQVQPWERLNVVEVLSLSGGRKPTMLPRFLCQILINVGYLLGTFLPRITGITRRVEMMWFGQSIGSTDNQVPYEPNNSALIAILREGLQK